MEILFIAFVVSLLTSLFGSTAGGAGLVVIPCLFFLGIDPHLAIASALVGYNGMSITGLATLHHAKKVDYGTSVQIALFAGIGSLIGTRILISIGGVLVEKLVAICMIIVIVLIALRPQIGLETVHKERKHKVIGSGLFVLQGIYSVLIASGSSVWANFIIILCFGKSFMEAIGCRKVLFITTNLVATVVYGFAGLVIWPLAGVMFLGNAIGTFIGIRYALTKGDAFVRRMFLIVAAVSALKMLV